MKVGESQTDIVKTATTSTMTARNERCGSELRWLWSAKNEPFVLNMQLHYTKVENQWLLGRATRAWGPCAQFIAGGELALEDDEDIMYKRRLVLSHRHADDFYCVPDGSTKCADMF